MNYYPDIGRYNYEILQNLNNYDNIIDVIEDIIEKKIRPFKLSDSDTSLKKYIHILDIITDALLQCNMPNHKLINYSYRQIDTESLKIYYKVVKYIYTKLEHPIPETKSVIHITRFIVTFLLNKTPTNDKTIVLIITLILNQIYSITQIDLIEFFIPKNIDDLLKLSFRDKPFFPDIPYSMNNIDNLADQATTMRDRLHGFIHSNALNPSRVKKLNTAIMISLHKNKLIETRYSIDKDNSYNVTHSSSSKEQEQSKPKEEVDSSIFDKDGYINFKNSLIKGKSVLDGAKLEKIKTNMLYDIKKYRDNPLRLFYIQNTISTIYIKSKMDLLTIKYNSSKEKPWDALKRYILDHSKHSFKLGDLLSKRLIIEDSNPQNHGLDYGGLYKDFMTKVIEYTEKNYLILKDHSNNYVINPDIDKNIFDLIFFSIVLNRMLIDNMSFSVPLSWSIIYALTDKSFQKEHVFVLYFLDAKPEEAILRSMINTCNNTDLVEGGTKRKIDDSEPVLLEVDPEGEAMLVDPEDEPVVLVVPDSEKKKKQRNTKTYASEYCNLDYIYDLYNNFASIDILEKIISETFNKSKIQGIGKVNCRDIYNILCQSIDIVADAKYLYKNNLIKYEFQSSIEFDPRTTMKYVFNRIKISINKLFNMSDRKFNDLFKLCESDIVNKGKKLSTSFSSASVEVDLRVARNTQFTNSLFENMNKFKQKHAKEVRYKEFLKLLFHFWTGSKSINKNAKDLIINLTYNKNTWHGYNDSDGFGVIHAHTCSNTLDVSIHSIVGDDDEGLIDQDKLIGDIYYTRRDPQIRNYQARFVALVLYCYTPEFQTV